MFTAVAILCAMTVEGNTTDVCTSVAKNNIPSMEACEEFVMNAAEDIQLRGLNSFPPDMAMHIAKSLGLTPRNSKLSYALGCKEQEYDL
jgi:uncharacterized protein YrrD